MLIFSLRSSGSPKQGSSGGLLNEPWIFGHTLPTTATTTTATQNPGSAIFGQMGTALTEMTFSVGFGPFTFTFSLANIFSSISVQLQAVIYSCITGITQAWFGCAVHWYVPRAWQV